MRSITAPLLKLSLFALVTVVLTGVLAMTIGASTSSTSSDYTARFADASGLNLGDDVRMAGVKVGRITGLEVVDGKHALVSFDVDAHRRLPVDASATVKYRNLAGQRYLALDAPIGEGDEVLPPGGEIPLERTHPALNLTALFNGFKPLFQALSPEDVNQLSGELVQVLQGEAGTVDSLLAHTASLTTTLARKDEVIGQVIDNLNTAVGAVNARGPQLGELITSLQQLTSGLAEQRKPVGEAVAALDELAGTTGDLLAEGREPLQRNIAELQRFTTVLNAEMPKLEHDLQTVPERLNALTRTVSYGSWFNFYLCRMSGTVGISDLNIKIPILPAPPSEMPERCQS
ncbi:phospholipid/cholesterol/gamma-HCH transport system substrate-binding protein [Saccharopolyspora kobensis]|uniref:Phospholipid/cholesterol/gamma-HCH transport system substrate-binding protein n=1 Tax=Saccharopolyspora kobensis TaxID=146035 RepID=A0A1H6EGT0_9PSEU|nr:MCE family protein [Saccharopolyspora kobensis]SEG96473.1 phospholipid/cholesterol/gamma-HCH transport system substrate-binding protein [Saccharopolyspora kobensis]SFF07317.1 phospholipid/cholesterol/gamma-HCH transport system substrate-binding protein [Saccharopolyspora kobensis]